MRKRVLVVGAYGETGRHAAALLADNPQLAVTAAGRRHDPLARLGVELAGRLTLAQVDFDDAERLVALAREHDLVLNMAGPMSLVADKVAKAALAAGAHYVDPGGSTALYDRLAPRRGDFEASGRTAVVCTGWISGLSELLPAALLASARSRLSRIDGFHAICGDNNSWSPTATRDVVDYLRKGEGLRQIAFLRDGVRVARNPLTMWRWFDLPGPVGRVRAMRRLTDEFLAIAGGDFRETGANFALMSLGSLLTMAWTRNRAIPLDKAVAMVERARKADQERFHLNSFVAGEATGVLDGVAVREAWAMPCPDHNRATGAAASVAVAHIVQGRSRPGVWYAAQAFDPSAFLADFTALGFPVFEQSQEARTSYPRAAE